MIYMAWQTANGATALHLAVSGHRAYNSQLLDYLITHKVAIDAQNQVSHMHLF
jgi:hypothetical protein